MGEEQCSRTLRRFWVPPKLFSTWFGWKMAFSESVHVGFRCNHWPIICLPLWMYRNKKRNRIMRIHVYRYTRNKIRIDIRALGLPHQRPIYLAKKKTIRGPPTWLRRKRRLNGALFGSILLVLMLVGWLEISLLNFRFQCKNRFRSESKLYYGSQNTPRPCSFLILGRGFPHSASFTEPDNTIISGYNIYIYISICIGIWLYIYIYISPKLPKLPIPKASDIWKGCNYSWKLKLDVVWSGKSNLEKAWIKDWFPDSRKDQRFEEGESSILRCHDLDLMIDKWSLTIRTTFTRFMSPPYKDSLWEICQKFEWINIILRPHRVVFKTLTKGTIIQ